MSNTFAFPSHGSMGEVVEQGMTLRDYFAAKAMQGIITNDYDGYTMEEMIKLAWVYADAMLKEREK